MVEYDITCTFKNRDGDNRVVVKLKPKLFTMQEHDEFLEFLFDFVNRCMSI